MNPPEDRYYKGVGLRFLCGHCHGILEIRPKDGVSRIPRLIFALGPSAEEAEQALDEVEDWLEREDRGPM